MNLYLITQTENNCYDTFDSAVVVADCADDARQILPGFWDFVSRCGKWREAKWDGRKWATHPDNVTAKYVGSFTDEKPGTVICASFNAG